MESGIYVLRFANGCYYIGKSDNIPKRWKQHWKDFENGTHAKKMQDCYDRYGYPEPEVFLRCHRDHVDLYESIIIRMNLGEKCLNGAIPFDVPSDEIPVLMNHPEFILESTANHFKTMLSQKEDIDMLKGMYEESQASLEQLENKGIVMPSEIAVIIGRLEDRVKELEESNTRLNSALDTIEQLGWIDRLFNFKQYMCKRRT